MSINSSSNLPPLPSERKFGLLFAAIGAGLAVWGYFKGWPAGTSIGLAAAGGVFLVLAWLAPSVLAPLNKLWFGLGLLLGKLVSPVVLGLMFYLLITPFAIVGRMMGRDELRLKKRQVASYWIDRPVGAPASESFKNQF